MKTCCCFPVLTCALPFALRTHIFGYAPLNPWGAPALVHTKHGGIDSSHAGEVVAGICRVDVPVPTRDPVWCSGVMFPLATSPVSPLPGPGGPQEGWGTPALLELRLQRCRHR